MTNLFVRKKSNKHKAIQQDRYNKEQEISVALQGYLHGVVISHIDCEQRYTFINNPNPDFCPEESIGKRDDEIVLNDGTVKLRELKKRVIETGIAEKALISFPVNGDFRTYQISVEAMQGEGGKIVGATSVAVDISELKSALAEISTENEILPLCSYCKSVKNESGEWEQVDVYITHHSKTHISHGICPECMEERYPDIYARYTEHVSPHNPH
jgi:hypothetical protein